MTKKFSTGHERYPHIRSEEIDFGRNKHVCCGADHEMISEFLKEAEDTILPNHDLHEWKQHYDDHPEDDIIDIIFEDLGQPVPTVPSTMLYAFSKHDVHMWVVENATLDPFKENLIDALKNFIKNSGPALLKKEISAAIKHGFEHNLSHDDIMKILNDIVTAEVTET